MADREVDTLKYFSDTNMRRILSVLRGIIASNKSIADQCIVAFSETTTYSPGMACFKDDSLYLCKTTHLGSWNDAHFTVVDGTTTDELTADDIEYIMTSVSSETWDYLEKLIDDTAVSTSKVYSSSKVYTDLVNTLKESKDYTVQKIAESQTPHFVIISDPTTEVTEEGTLYLQPKDDGTCAIYIVKESAPYLVQSSLISLDDYLKSADAETTYLSKTDATSTYESIENFENVVGTDVLKTTDQTVIGAVNEVREQTFMKEMAVAEGTDIIAYIEERATKISPEFNCIEFYRCMNSLTSPSADSDNDYHYEVSYVYNDVDHKWIRIVAKSVRTNDIYVRSCSNGTWSDWERIAKASSCTNPNLVDNPWFTINQRGLSTYSSVGYTVDRFKNYSADHTVTVNSDGSITLTNTSSNNSFWGQIADADTLKKLKGKTITVSVLGKVNSGTCVCYAYPLSVGSVSLGSELKVYSFTTTIPADNTSLEIFDINICANSEAVIYAAKAEVGTESTLANDVAPNYQQELAKCQRYFEKSAFYRTAAIATDNGGLNTGSYFYLEKKRAFPTIYVDDSVTTKVTIYDPSTNTWFSPESITLGAIGVYNTVMFCTYVQHADIVKGRMYLIDVFDNVWNISADL